MTIKTDAPGKTKPAEPTTPSFRPLYGVFINQDLNKFQDEISATVHTLEKGLADKEPNLQGKKAQRLAETALKQLKAALDEFKSPLSTDEPDEPAEPTTPGGTFRPLYGVFIENQVGTAKQQLTSQIDEINTALKGGRITKDDHDDVQAALGDLKRALAALNKIKEF